jgi:sec-independent protein translocase protein TatB
MFDFSWSELLVIGIVALVFIGPKELPGVLRTLGQWMSKVRRMAGEFQNQFHDAMREAELHDLKKEVDAMTSSYTKFDPLSDVRKDMEAAQREIETAVAGTAAEHLVPSTSPEPTPAATEPAPAETAHSPTPQVEAPAAAAEAPAEQRVEPAVQHGAAGNEPA